MKLADLRKKKEPFEISDGENTFKGFFKSLSVEDRAEKDAFYETAKMEALEYARRYVKPILDITKGYDDGTLRRHLTEYQKTYLYSSSDLLEIENENLENKEEAERKRLEEIKKGIEFIEKENEKATRDELEFYFAIMELREIYLYKMVAEMDKKILTLITLDENEQPVLSLDKDDERYIGDLSEDVFMELLDKSSDIRLPVTEQEIRRVIGDPDFLSLWQRLMEKG